MNPDDELIARFVASFASLDELSTSETLDPIAWQLAQDAPNEYGYKTWRPMKQATDAIYLEPLYAVLPARFPPLYEELVLSYRWADVDLQLFTLLANPPGTDLAPLLRRISGDKILWNHLIPAGYIPFGKGTDCDYDPVCFELKSRGQNADFRIVKIDHEEILCFDRLKVVGELASSFRELMLKVVALTEKANPQR